MPPGVARALWLAVGLCSLAGAAVEEPEACSQGQPQEDEDAEALAASTLLLQSSALHSRAPVRRGAPTGGQAIDARGEASPERPLHAARSALRHAVLRSLLGTLESPEGQVVREVLASRETPASDPFWNATYDRLRDLMLADPGAANYRQLCQSGDLEKYVATGCAPSADGSVVVNGSQADAYYCGSPGIDWAKAPYPVTSLCSARPGSAYGPDGFCGRLGKKQVLVNFATTLPHWKDNIFLVNVPSVDCILGLGDCDIQYCQHCPGRCS